MRLRARHKLAIVVPFRDREEHLRQLLPRLRAELARQRVTHDVLVVEQIDRAQPFNRGKLLNVGVTQTADHDYFCFHDVDLVPEASCDYGYPRTPTHLSAYCSQFGYELPYGTVFGGVTLFSERDFMRINGFSNEYWGWGAEDDDLRARCAREGLRVARRPGRYTSLPHERPSKECDEYRQNVARLARMSEGLVHPTTDGYGTLDRYEIVERRAYDDHVRVRVRFRS